MYDTTSQQERTTKAPPSVRLRPVSGDPFAARSTRPTEPPGARVRLKPVNHDPFNTSAAGAEPVKSSAAVNTDEGGEDSGLLSALGESFSKAGRDLVTGYKGSAASFYNTGANAMSLVNKAADYLAEHTGIGPMSRDTALGHAERYLRDAGRRVAPRPEEMPADTAGKVYQGLGSAPVAMGEYLAGMRALGPVLGFAATDALREADKGPGAAIEAGAKGALMGGILKAAEPLSRPLRTGAMATAGGTQAASEGGDVSDVVAGATVMGALGATSGKGNVRARDLLPRKPRLRPVQGNPFETTRARGAPAETASPSAQAGETGKPPATVIRPGIVNDPVNTVNTRAEARQRRAIDKAAHEAATSPKNRLPQPTDAQREAENYRVGRVKVHGLDISIENPRGSKREGTDPDGKRWSVTMRNHYGRIRRTEGADGDHVDVFLGDRPGSERVFIVNQKRPGGGWDEHKVMMGFTDRTAAEQAYLSNYAPDWLAKQGGRLDIRETSVDSFKSWLKSGDTSKPFQSAPAPHGRSEPVANTPRAVPEPRPAASTRQSVSEAVIEPVGEKFILVKGEPAEIRGRLQEAGVPYPGHANRKRGGLMFSIKREAEIRQALENGPRYSWSPGANYVGMIGDSTLPAGDIGAKAQAKPIRREDILRPFLKALDVPLYEGRVKRKGAAGFYLPKKEAVRIKSKSDLEVAAHELAHLMDDRIPAIRKSWTHGPEAKTYARELRGLSYDKAKVYEGFAEYVRLWMTQNQKARELAPNFTRWFEGFTASHEYGPSIHKAREGMTAWFGQDAVSRAASKIGEQKPLNEAMDNVFDRFRQSVADDLHGIYRMERSLTGEIAPVGAYETARLSRAAHSLVEGALTLGAPKVRPDGSHTFTGKGLKQILDGVAGNLDRFTLYAVGRSARELMMQGRERLFTPAEIRSMTALETPAFKRAFEEYQTWNRAVLDFAQAKGIINPETRSLWRRTQYLPFYRAMEGAPGGARGRNPGEFGGIQALKGGTGNLRPVLGNMIQNAAHLMTTALKNEARAKVADLAENVRGGGRFMVKIPTDAKRVAVDKAQIERFVYDLLGLDARQVKAGNIPPELVDTVAQLEAQFTRHPGFLKFWQVNQSPQGSNVVAVMRRGKPVFYEVADPLLYRAFSALDRPAQNWLTKFLGGFRRLGQASVTVSLDFMAANIARDTLMGGIMSRHGFRPFIDSVQGMKSRLLQDANYREFIANGGGFSSYLVDEAAFRKHLERFYTQRGIDYRAVIDTPAKLVYSLETIADAFEMSTRLGEFRQARGRGAHPRHAAYSAREVSTDFAMRGDSKVLGFMYDTVMFLKAGINGMDRVYRGFAHDPNRAHVAARTGLLALLSMGLYGLNRGNPLYEQMEDWDRDTNWHLFIPRAAYYDFVSLHGREPRTPDEAEGLFHHFRYPKIWEVGAVASVAERSLEQIMNAEEGTASAKRLAVDVSRIVGDLFKLDYVPQALAPLYEQAINENRFTGRPIEPQALQDLAPFARATPYTSEVMTDLGLATRGLPRSLQAPPARAEALLRGYFNTWALYGLTLADGMVSDDKPELRIDQYPVLRRFYVDDPARHTKYETQFYDMLREATELRRTMRHMDRVMRPDIGTELEERPTVREYRQLNRINEQVRGINQEMRAVYRNPDLSPKEKRQRIDNLTREKNRTLEAVVTDIEAQRSEVEP